MSRVKVGSFSTSTSEFLTTDIETFVTAVPPTRPWEGRYTVTKGSDLKRSNEKGQIAGMIPGNLPHWGAPLGHSTHWTRNSYCEEPD